MATFTRDINQQLLDRALGAGAVQAGGGRGEAALAMATPEQRQQYLDARRQYEPGYNFMQPAQFNAGVSPVGVVEPFNQIQKDALLRMAGGAGPDQFTQGAQGAFQSALQAAQRGGAPMTQADFEAGYQRYFNPYTQDVVQRSTDELRRQSDIALNRLKEKARGSFGSTSDALQRAELERNTLQTTGDLAATLNAAGFNTAVGNTLNQFNTDQSRALGAGGLFGNLMGQGLAARGMEQQNFMRDVGFPLEAGGMIQNQNQRLLDVVGGEINARRNFPYDQLSRFGNRFAPFQSSTSTGATPMQPSTVSQLGGLGMLIGSGFDSNNNFSLDRIFGR